PPDAARATCQFERLLALRIGRAVGAVLLVRGKAREREEGVGDVAVAVAGQEVTVVGPAEAVDQSDPAAAVLLEVLQFVGVDLVGQVHGDHVSIRQRDSSAPEQGSTAPGATPAGEIGSTGGRGRRRVRLVPDPALPHLPTGYPSRPATPPDAPAIHP